MTEPMKNAVRAAAWSATVGPLAGVAVRTLTGRQTDVGMLIVVVFATGFAFVTFGPAAFVLGLLAGYLEFQVYVRKGRLVAVTAATAIGAILGGAAAWLTAIAHGFNPGAVRADAIIGIACGAFAGTFACLSPRATRGRHPATT
jgi:hypothetical protein